MILLRVLLLVIGRIYPKEGRLGVLPSSAQDGGFHEIIQKLEICSPWLKGIIRKCLIHARDGEINSV